MQDYKRFSTRTSGLFTSLVEVWKDIEGYEGSYQVSSFGRVKSLARYRTGRNGSRTLLKESIRKIKIGNNGYCSVSLCKDGVKTHPNVHRLVAKAFLKPIVGKETVNHLDGVKTNNNVSNLEWADLSDQIVHAIATGLIIPRGEPKFSKAFKQEIFEYYHSHEISIVKLAKMFGVSSSTARNIVRKGVAPRPTTRKLKDGTVTVESILTQDQVKEIKLLRSQGWTFKMLAEKFNRGLSQMHRVVNNLSRNTDIE